MAEERMASRFAPVWIVINIGAMALWLRAASSIWPFPGEEHCAPEMGNLMYGGFILLPGLAIALLAQITILTLGAVRLWRKRGAQILVLATLTTFGWILTAGYDHYRGFRHVTSECPYPQ